MVNDRSSIEEFLNNTLPTGMTGVISDSKHHDSDELLNSGFELPTIGLNEEQRHTEQTIDDILGDYSNITIKKSIDNLSDEYAELMYSDKDVLKIIVNDIDLFTRLKDDCIQNTEDEFMTEVSYLENIRVFSNGILKNSGIFYSESMPWLIDNYPYLRRSTITSVVNSVYDDKHVYPICLPDGKVFTHMGYDVDSLLQKINTGASKFESFFYDKSLAPKYQISSQLWVQQDRLLANLESLKDYDGSCVYVVEGYFDAKRINDQWGKKSIALLSSKLSRNKLIMLNAIKQQGHCLVYIPDSDDAGLNEKLIKNPIWDEIYYMPKISENITEYKDIDNYVKFQYLKRFNLTEETIDMKKNLQSNGKINIPFHEEGTKEKLIARRNKV